jgi:hypothetical protein
LATVWAVVAWRTRDGAFVAKWEEFLHADDAESRAALLRQPVVPAPAPWVPPAAPLPDADVLWVREFSRALIERRPASSELGEAHLDAWARVATRARDEGDNAPLRAAFAQLAEASQRTLGVEAFEPAPGSRVDAAMMEVISGPASGGAVVETLRLGLRSRAEVLRKALVRTVRG